MHCAKDRVKAMVEDLAVLGDGLGKLDLTGDGAALDEYVGKVEELKKRLASLSHERGRVLRTLGGLEIDIQDARLRAAHGFGMGDVVECRERCAYGPPKVWRMQVTKVLFYQRENGRGHPALVSLEGLKLKKDGTVGKMKGSVYYHDVDKVKLIEGGE